MTVCFLDLETTGLDPRRHEIYEIGLIVDDLAYRWWLPVERLDRAAPDGLRISRYYERYPQGLIDEPSEDAAWQETARLDSLDEQMAHPVGVAYVAWQVASLTAGRHLVGAVPSFDAAFLERWLRKWGCSPAWHYHLIDTEALIAGYLAGQHPTVKVAKAQPPWDSTALFEAVGVFTSDVDRHTALGDALSVRAAYLAVMEAEEQ